METHDKISDQNGHYYKVVDFENKYRKPADESTFCTFIKDYVTGKFTKRRISRFLNRSFPFVSNIRTYRFKQDIMNDIIAGFTVGIMQIPQGMAYAMLSSLPPVCGLYISFFSPLAYFFLGSSRHASMGCISVVSLMMGSIIDSHFPRISERTIQVTSLKDTTTSGLVAYNISSLKPAVTNGSLNAMETVETLETYFDPRVQAQIELAASVSLLSGFIMILAGRIGLGFITTFMPEQMVSGFTSAVGIIVASNQAKHIFGLALRPQVGSFKLIKTWVDIFANIKDTNYIPVVITIICMLFMYIVKIHVNQRFKDRMKIPIPVEIIVVALATTASHYGNFQNLSILREIPAGLPKPSVPDVGVGVTYFKEAFIIGVVAFTHLPKPSVPDVGVGVTYFKEAFIIGVVAFTQSVSMAKILARKNNYSIDANQEMVAYGASSVVCSLFSGYIPAASVSRSMIQDGAGGKTQVASLFGSIVVLIIIVAVGPLFYSLPKCVLSAIIIINLRAMFLQFLEVKSLWQKSKADFFIWIVTFSVTLLLDADIGIATGILISVLIISFRIQRSKGLVVGHVDRSDILKDVTKYEECEVSDGYIIVQYPAPVCFTNSDKFVEDVYKISGVNPAKVQKATKRNNKKEKLQNNEEENGSRRSEKEDFVIENDTEAVNITHTNVILDMRGVSFVDLAGVKALRRIFADYEKIGVTMYVSECNDSVLSTLKTTNLLYEKPDIFYVDTSSVITALTQ